MRIRALDAGADDYLELPYDAEDLKARVRALLRRAPALTAPIIHLGDVRLDTNTQRVVIRDHEVALTAKEYAILEYMARNPDALIARSVLWDHVWDANHDPASRALEVHISNIRRKISQHSRDVVLHCRRGAGYVLKVHSDARGTD